MTNILRVLICLVTVPQNWSSNNGQKSKINHLSFKKVNFLSRFSSVAGYNCSLLTGVSFFSLVHAADIGPVSRAFKNCKYNLIM